MNIFPPFKTAKPRVRRKRQRVEPAAGPSGTVTVLSVMAETDNFIRWTFSADASTGGSGIPQLLIQTSEGWEAPSESWQGATANEIVFNYDNGAVLPGAPWQVNAQPVGIAFAGGQLLVVPQSGVVG